MSVGIPLYRLFAISRLTSAQSCLSTASLQLQRRVCLTSYYSSKNCHTGPENINSIMWSRRAVLKPEASWQKLTYNCGFHTTPQIYTANFVVGHKTSCQSCISTEWQVTAYVCSVIFAASMIMEIDFLVIMC